jgi:hypothetical protein
MSAMRMRQLRRLERLAQPYLKWQQRAEEQWQNTIDGAASHAAVLAFLFRYGDPKIGQPLSSACERISECPVWKELCDDFPVWLNQGGTYEFNPHSREAVSLIGLPMRHAVNFHFRGRNEKEKLKSVFASAPHWLIWFTFGDYTAKLLNLPLPDLSDMTAIARGEDDFHLWWGLPRGAFRHHRWSNGPQNEPLARTNLNLLRPDTPTGDRQTSPRQLRREQAARERSDHIEHDSDWPVLLSADYLKLSARELMALTRSYSDQNHLYHESIKHLRRGQVRRVP